MKRFEQIVAASGVTLDDTACASNDEVLASHAQFEPTSAVFAKPGLSESA